MQSVHRPSGLLVVSVALFAGACAGRAEAPTVSERPNATSVAESVATLPGPTVAPVSVAPTVAVPTSEAVTTAVTESTAPTGAALDVREIVEALASPEFEGRDNGTPGSARSQAFLIEQLRQFAQPAVTGQSGDDGYRQVFADGTNIVGLIPGAELANEYVIVGAHYDHLGVGGCPTAVPGEEVCAGATDNATGVAAAMSVLRSIVADGQPRRSIILAFWDAEEDNLLGSKAYVESPLVPLEQTIAYVNFDIQGLVLLPSMASTTVVVGAETGGPSLMEATVRAAGASTLASAHLSLVFGQGRSDHASFAGAGVPSVFYTDANSGCYHTAQDDLAAVDFGKLDQQIAAAETLTRDLVATDTPPVFDPSAPLSRFEDAMAMRDVVTRGMADLALFPDVVAASLTGFQADLDAIVAAGAESYDDAAGGRVLAGSAMLVAALAELPCATAG